MINDSRKSQEEIIKEKLEDIEASFRFFDDWKILCTTADQYAKKLTALGKRQKKF